MAGLLLYFPLSNPDLAKLTWALGAILSVSKISYESWLRREIEPVKEMAKIIDLGHDNNVEELRAVQDIYLRIVEPEFAPVKGHILAQARDALLRLSNDKTSEPLAAGEYYAWLLPMLASANKNSKIRAISVMMDSEWDDSPTERKFLQASIDAASRGAVIERVFLMPDAEVKASLENPAIREQTEEDGPELFQGFLVKSEYLANHDPALYGRIGDGFIAFDDRVALIDIATPGGQARGQVTMNSAEISRLINLHDQLLLHSERLSTSSTKTAGGTE